MQQSYLILIFTKTVEWVQYGVPQGSILRLLLLLTYVNDIDTNISNDIGIKLTLFDDDT